MPESATWRWLGHHLRSPRKTERNCARVRLSIGFLGLTTMARPSHLFRATGGARGEGGRKLPTAALIESSATTPSKTNPLTTLMVCSMNCTTESRNGEGLRTAAIVAQKESLALTGRDRA